MFGRRVFRSIFLLTMLGLVACANGVIVTSERIDQSYDPMQPGFATRNGEQIAIVVFGTPFGADPGELNAILTSALNDSAIGVAAEFAIDPAQPATQNSRVVLAFNAPKTTDGTSLCRGMRPATTTTSPGELQVTAAYCEGSVPLTEVRVRASGAERPDSAQFHDLTFQIAQALFPSFNPNLGQEGDGCINC